jgi:hypothetical protein
VSREPKSLSRDRPAVRGVRSVEVVCVRAVADGAAGEKRTHSSDCSRVRFRCGEEVAPTSAGGSSNWNEICRDG